MQATMIKLEMNAKMEKAIARCKANHPKVRRVDAATVKVFGKGAVYTVRIYTPKPGLTVAACDCKAGLKSQLCYHVPAALVAPELPSQRPTWAAEYRNLCQTCGGHWYSNVPANHCVLHQADAINTTLANSLANVVPTAPLTNSLVNGATIPAAPAVATVPTMPAAEACALTVRVEQSYGGIRYKVYYCDGWPV